jgi:hypothetical protein
MGGSAWSRHLPLRQSRKLRCGRARKICGRCSWRPAFTANGRSPVGVVATGMTSIAAESSNRPSTACCPGWPPSRRCEAANGDRFRDISDNYPRPALRVGLCACRQHVAPGIPAGERVVVGTSADSVGSYPLLALLAGACFRRQPAILRTGCHVGLPPGVHFRKAKRHSSLRQLLHSLGTFLLSTSLSLLHKKPEHTAVLSFRLATVRPRLSTMAAYH